MTNLINQITINGLQTTFLNYVNPVVGAESLSSNLLLAVYKTFFDTAWSAGYFLQTSEVMFQPPSDPVDFRPLSGGRFRVKYNDGSLVGVNQGYINTSLNPSPLVLVFPSSPSASVGTHTFGVANIHGYCLASFSSSARASLVALSYRSWAKNNVYTGSQRTRGFVCLDITSNTVRDVFRPVAENSSAKQTLLTSNPTLSCTVSTPGANATDVLARDSTSPNNYIGQFWNMIVLPSSAVVGKIYKNTGIDPDTGIVETDQKAFWMCVGSWGTDKIGMRVWTENIT